LAPAAERKWGAYSIFNVRTSDVYSLWGTCGWFFGVAIGGAVYYALRMSAAAKSAKA